MARKKSSEQSSAMTFSHAVRQCVDSGKVEFGANTGVKSALSGRAKMVIISSNCPSNLAADVKHYCKLSSIPLLTYEGTSIELGTIAGRPHSVSMLAVHDAGNSGILEFAKQ